MGRGMSNPDKKDGVGNGSLRKRIVGVVAPKEEMITKRLDLDSVSIFNKFHNAYIPLAFTCSKKPPHHTHIVP